MKPAILPQDMQWVALLSYIDCFAALPAGRMIAAMLAGAPHEPLQTYEAFLGPLRPWVLASVQLDPGAAAMHFHVALPKARAGSARMPGARIRARLRPP